MENIDTNALTDLAVSYGIKLAMAVATLVIGLYIVSVILKVVNKAFERGDMDPSLQSFLGSMIGHPL